MENTIQVKGNYVFKFQFLVFLILLPQIYMYSKANEFNFFTFLYIYVFTILIWINLYAELNIMSVISFVQYKDNGRFLTNKFIFQISRIIGISITLLFYVLAIIEKFHYETLLTLFPLLVLFKRYFLPKPIIISDQFLIKQNTLYRFTKFSDVVSNEENKVSCILNEQEITIPVHPRDRYNLLQELQLKITHGDKEKVFSRFSQDSTVKSFYYHLKQYLITLTLTFSMIFFVLLDMSSKYYPNEDDEISYIIILFLLVVILSGIIKQFYYKFSRLVTDDIEFIVYNQHKPRRRKTAFTILISIGFYYYFYFIKEEFWSLSISTFLLYLYWFSTFLSQIIHKRKVKRYLDENNLMT